MKQEAIALRWCERVGSVHAHPSNVISHAVDVPVLACLLWRRDIGLAASLGAVPMVGTVPTERDIRLSP